MTNNTRPASILECAYALAMLDMAGDIARVQIEDAATMDAPTVDVYGDAVASVTVDTIRAGYRAAFRTVGIDPLATRSHAAPVSAASVTRDPFRR